MKERSYREVYVCKHHCGLAIDIAKDGEYVGTVCSEGGEWIDEDDMVAAVAWVYLWEEFGFDENPFKSSLNTLFDHDTGIISDETP